VEELRGKARQRVDLLKSMGFNKAQIYGDTDILGGLNVFYLLLDDPEEYSQPRAPQLPMKNVVPGSLASVGTAILLGLSAVFAFRERGMRGRRQPVAREEG
jgi:formate dehydrogenase iron-sulfur subunit